MGVDASELARPRRRLSKLELAVIGFLAFDVLLFGVWKLVGAASGSDSAAVAQLEAEPQPLDEPRPGPEPEQPEPSLAEPEDPEHDRDPSVSVHEAIAAELPPEPDTPGPVRPTAKTLSDKAFRQAMVEARDAMLRKCLDTRMRRTLKVALKVAPSGKVEYARVVGSQNETSLGQCVVKQVYKIDFPPTNEGGSHTYTLRLR